MKNSVSAIPDWILQTSDFELHLVAKRPEWNKD